MKIKTLMCNRIKLFVWISTLPIFQFFFAKNKNIGVKKLFHVIFFAIFLSKSQKNPKKIFGPTGQLLKFLFTSQIFNFQQFTSLVHSDLWMFPRHMNHIWKTGKFQEFDSNYRNFKNLRFLMSFLSHLISFWNLCSLVFFF